MTTFRTLELAIQFNQKVEQVKIKGHLRDQLLRACTSIALNLSEGNAKQSVKEKKRYYQTAYASLKECQTIFRLIGSTNSELEKFADHLGASLYRLMNAELKTIQPNGSRTSRSHSNRVNAKSDKTF